MKPGIDYPGVSVVFLCHDDYGRFAMALRSENCRDEHGCWDPGGGKLDPHEDVLDAVAREVSEEYGLKTKKITFLGYRDVHREHDNVKTHWVALDFRVLVEGTLINAEPHKHEAVGWFTRATLPWPVHSQFPEFLSKYREDLWII